MGNPSKLVELSLPQGYPFSHVNETEINNGEMILLEGLSLRFGKLVFGGAYN